MEIICQTRLPQDMHAARALPGVQPLRMADWLQVDDAYAAQMTLRARLLDLRRPEVLHEGCDAASAELLDLVLKQLRARDDFDVTDSHVRRPDGVRIARDGTPLWQLGHLVQEDLCILEKPPQSDEHILGAAVLCFPASWRLADKVNRPLTGIHDPVPGYAGDLARRVQRLFNGIQPGRPLWRFNQLWYHDPALFQPVSHEAHRAPDARQHTGHYLRCERQSLLRLPVSAAVVFSIHTYVLPRAVVPTGVGAVETAATSHRQT